MGTVLSDSELEQFITQGHVIVTNCFTRDVALRWCDLAFERLNWKSGDETSRVSDRVYLHTTAQVPLRDFSTKLWLAICELLGGASRIQESFVWDSFIVTFQSPDAIRWAAPSPKIRGWHIDGDSFRHFLDSQENALVALFHWTSTAARGGGTFVACDSIPVVARYLAQHPEGVLPREFPYGDLVRECSQFREITVDAGSVLLLHPFTLHSASINEGGFPRIITNSNIRLREPKGLNRPHSKDYSVVEKAILRALRADRYDFCPTAPREQFPSPRVLEARSVRAADRRADPR